MKRRFLFIGVPSALAAACYGAFWWIAATRAIDGIERWTQDRRFEGWVVSHAPPRASGFPLWLTLEIGRPRIEVPTARGSVTWSGGALHARTRPWRFRRIELSAAGGHETRYVHLPSRGIVVARGRDDTGTVTIGPDGRAQEVRISAAPLGVSAPLSGQEIRVGSMVAVITPAAGGALPRSVSAAVSAVELPQDVRAPFGNLIQAVEMAATIEGSLPPGPLPDALAAWRNAGGALQIEQIAVRWGPLAVNAEGRLSLDSDLQPAGALTVGARGFNEALARLARDGEVEAADAAAVGLVLSLLARPGPDGGLRVTVPVSIEDRVVTAGPQRLARLPRIVWR